MVTSSTQKIVSMSLACVCLAACGDGAGSTGAAKDSAATATTSSTPAKSAAPVASNPTTPSATTSVAAATPSASDSAAKPPASGAPSTVASSGTGPAKGPTAGKPWQVVASAEADAGFHCNDEYPNKFITNGGTNVTYPDPKPRGGCSGNTVVVNVPIVPTAAGPGTVVGTLSYGICDDSKTKCLSKKKEMTLSFTAAP